LSKLTVTKRDGSLESFDVEKIKQVIEWACEDLEVNPLALESKFDEFLFDGIPTTMLQKNLIEHSKALVSPQEPDWVFVAGRLKTMNRWADTRSYDIEFKDFFQQQKALGYWTHEAFDIYTEEQIEEIGEWIDKEYDLAHSYASVVTAESKYLMPNECIQHLFAGEAMITAFVEKPEDRMKWCKIYFERFRNRKHSLASPWLSNLRNNGNISSCFIIAPSDSLESIFDNFKNAGMISKAGGGLGYYLGFLRALGSDLMGNEGAATGVIGWAKIINDIAVFVNQGGKRSGAITTALPIWHADISEFLDLQTEAGDQRKKAHDVMLQVTMHDKFMELKDDAQATWYTFCPHEVKEKLSIDLPESYDKEFNQAYDVCVQAAEKGVLKVVRKFNAKDLFKKLMKVAFETGLPYLAYIDEINRHNPNKHEGNIYCVNLCVESFSVMKPDEYGHTCNLLSLVVGRIPMDELSEEASIAVRLLDNGIELTKPPVKESAAHNDRYRTVGVGILGLADIIAREGSSFMNSKFVTEVAERIMYGCVTGSIQLAKERGAYPAFKGSMWDTGEMIQKFHKESVCDDLDWPALQSDIDKYGIRNSQMTSPAPNTTTALFMDAGPSWTPVYSALYFEDNKDGPMPVVAMYLKENPLSYARNITKFKPWELTNTVAALQKFVDTGISAEYLMDKNQEDFKAKWLWDTWDQGWKKKTKAAYYIRTIKKGDSYVKDNDVCVGCAG
jgi:ribonucleoside-diphosphate reductase alpha chain